jgi:hypothetical protein
LAGALVGGCTRAGVAALLPALELGVVARHHRGEGDAADAARHIDPDRIRALVRRARLAGLAPALRLSGRRGLQQDLTSSSSIQAEKLAAAVADDLNFEAALSFDLSRLVFAPEEVRLLSVERWLAADQKRLLEEAIRLFFQRRKLLLERARNAAPDPELDSSIAELEALLDALTEGAFSRAL